MQLSGNSVLELLIDGVLYLVVWLDEQLHGVNNLLVIPWELHLRTLCNVGGD